MIKNIKYLKIILVVLLLLCLLDMPYGYYELVRFLGMVGFGILAYTEKDSSQKGWFIFWISSAVLINPLIKISLGRGLWNVLDLIWAVVLIISYLSKKKSNE